jgi:hypothetical protein
MAKSKKKFEYDDIVRSNSHLSSEEVNYRLNDAMTSAAEFEAEIEFHKQLIKRHQKALRAHNSRITAYNQILEARR